MTRFSWPSSATAAAATASGSPSSTTCCRAPNWRWRTAALAPLVAAALLHDIGHFEEPEPANGEPPRDDLAHEVRAARSLSTLFGPDVWRPVALHVAAKRYLCAVEPGYLEALSPASLASLKVQGGTFTSDQAARFIALPYAGEAICLRRYDDGAKREGWRSPPLSHYRALLEGLAAATERGREDCVIENI